MKRQFFGMHDDGMDCLAMADTPAGVKALKIMGFSKITRAVFRINAKADSDIRTVYYYNGEPVAEYVGRSMAH